MKRPRLSSLLVVAAALAVIVTGCTHKANLDKTVEAKPKAPRPLDLAKFQPNELGEVPILEYHELGSGKHGPYEFPLQGFKKDMWRLYRLGYRPVSLHEYVSGHIDLPAGLSPVVITFDDALRGQVDFDATGQLDPNCAAGALIEMHKQHPDWPVKAVFFVLPMRGNEVMFYQKEFTQKKLQWLVQQGFEVGNHTLHHLPGMNHWPDARAMAEFAGGQALINKYLPGYPVDTLALPFGIYPKNQKLVIAGQSAGVSYHNVCAMLAGAGPAPSPGSTKFKPYRIPRIIPGTKLMEIGWWLDYLEKHKGLKYVSDGDPYTVTVHEADKAKVQMARLTKNDLFFRSYVPSAVAPPAASSDGKLSKKAAARAARAAAKAAKAQKAADAVAKGAGSEDSPTVAVTVKTVPAGTASPTATPVAVGGGKAGGQ